MVGWTSTNAVSGWIGASMSPWHPGGAPHSVSLSRNRWISHHQQAQLHSQIQLARIQQAVRREQAAAKAQGMIAKDSTGPTFPPQHVLHPRACAPRHWLQHQGRTSPRGYNTITASFGML